MPNRPPVLAASQVADVLLLLLLILAFLPADAVGSH